MKHGGKNRSNARKLPVSTGSELIKGTDSEQRPKNNNKSQFSELSFASYMVSREMWSVQHANEQQQICSAAGNWHRQSTTTDLVWCHLSWLGSCQSWYVLTIQFTPRRQADKERTREKLLKAFKQNALSYRSGLFFFFLRTVNVWGLSNCVRGVGSGLETVDFLFSFLFPAYLRPLIMQTTLYSSLQSVRRVPVMTPVPTRG